MPVVPQPPTLWHVVLAARTEEDRAILTCAALSLRVCADLLPALVAVTPPSDPRGQGRGQTRSQGSLTRAAGLGMSSLGGAGGCPLRPHVLTPPPPPPQSQPEGSRPGLTVTSEGSASWSIKHVEKCGLQS